MTAITQQAPALLAAESVDANATFQRAPAAPNLPAKPTKFIGYFLAQNRWWYISILLLETAHASCGIAVPYAIAEIIRGVTTASEQSLSLIENLKAPLWLFLGLSIGEVLFGRSAGTLQMWLQPVQRQDVTRALYAYLQCHSFRYFSSDYAGALAHRISETSMGVLQTIWAILFDFWPIAIILSVSIGLLYTAHPTLALFVSIWSFFFILISYQMAKRCRPYAHKASSARSETNGILVDSVSNLSTARFFARFGFERQYLNARFEKELKPIRVANNYSERVRWFQFVSAAVLKVGILYFSLTLWGQGKIGVPEFVMALSVSLLIINEARNLSRRFLDFFEYLGNVSNGVNTIIVPHELVDASDAVDVKLNHGEIEFRNVSFSYAKDKPVFDNLSIKIPAGQRVGLVGYSGSGKTTFINLILRTYDAQSGEIFIGGHHIRQLTQDALHTQIGLIPQDPTLFHRSLIENIRYGHLQASDDEVIEAARKAHAHDFITTQGEGYQSLVGERGVKLSGGQRQRIAIARVILKNAPILILDEATSSLDSITEESIQVSLETAMQDKTAIVIAHRLSTIAHLDRILVFDAGRIVEDGTHEALLQLKGTYYQLWGRQTGGFLPENYE
ncbi:MAG: ABC transporter ATP-binding protein [Betaproteobacteria bacterium HGW-Betaproteobacteria-22]|nr:MAG: ABC transporter ATP-binding protein [Betaproteobacteria bacterium HGW-Betaproteobacteria-22]